VSRRYSIWKVLGQAVGLAKEQFFQQVELALHDLEVGRGLIQALGRLQGMVTLEELNQLDLLALQVLNGNLFFLNLLIQEGQNVNHVAGVNVGVNDGLAILNNFPHQVSVVGENISQYISNGLEGGQLVLQVERHQNVLGQWQVVILKAQGLHFFVNFPGPVQAFLLAGSHRAGFAHQVNTTAQNQDFVRGTDMAEPLLVPDAGLQDALDVTHDRIEDFVAQLPAQEVVAVDLLVNVERYAVVEAGEDLTLVVQVHVVEDYQVNFLGQEVLLEDRIFGVAADFFPIQLLGSLCAVVIGEDDRHFEAIADEALDGGDALATIQRPEGDAVLASVLLADVHGRNGHYIAETGGDVLLFLEDGPCAIPLIGGPNVNAARLDVLIAKLAKIQFFLGVGGRFEFLAIENDRNVNRNQNFSELRHDFCTSECKMKIATLKTS